AAPLAASQASAGEGDAEGASFEPTSDDGTTPRRLADLEPGMELEGRVTSTALYGIFVDVGVGRDGLVHISEMSDQRIESPTDLVQIGDTVKVRVKSVDADARRISLTMRTPRSESGEGRRRNRAPKRPEVNLERLGEINPGDLIEGTVNGIAPFGVFVDIGVGKDGLVHISELADGRVEKAEDAVTVGQSYTFRVLEVDAEGQRISLSLRRAQEGYQERPRTGGGSTGGGRRREANLDAIAPGTILEGKVSGIAPFGAFVDLGVGRDGLVHISELAEGRIGKVEDVVNVGDPVKVRVIEVDPSSKRISLSMRLEVPIGPVSTSGSSRLDRDWTNPAERGGRGENRGGPGGARGGTGGGPRRDRTDNRPPREPEVISFGGEEEEEVFEGGNATLDDLLSKFGSEDSRRPSKKRYEREEEEGEEGDTREVRARRDAIRRTLRDTYEE
ncbi:MAG TPA: S1 RNA-binding domain-containing protein, partial [Brevundimonas sp.]|nr:S1 RNA-binding domain-containing protein [Brevundimonas sp.]